jgi:hypothetical protein
MKEVGTRCSGVKGGDNMWWRERIAKSMKGKPALNYGFLNHHRAQ